LVRGSWTRTSEPRIYSVHITSLYPTLYGLERKGLIDGRWVEKTGQRRRRYYRLTRGGRGTLVRQRSIWQNFAQAINRVAGIK